MLYECKNTFSAFLYHQCSTKSGTLQWKVRWTLSPGYQRDEEQLPGEVECKHGNRQLDVKEGINDIKDLKKMKKKKICWIEQCLLFSLLKKYYEFIVEIFTVYLTCLVKYLVWNCDKCFNALIIIILKTQLLIFCKIYT